MSKRLSAAYLGAGCLLLAGPVDALALSLPSTCFSPSGLVVCRSAAPPPAADGALASPVLLGAVVLFSVSLPVWLPGCCAIAIGATSSPAASNTAWGIVVMFVPFPTPGGQRAGFNAALRHHTTLWLRPILGRGGGLMGNLRLGRASVQANHQNGDDPDAPPGSGRSRSDKRHPTPVVRPLQDRLGGSRWIDKTSSVRLRCW